MLRVPALVPGLRAGLAPAQPRRAAPQTAGSLSCDQKQKCYKHTPTNFQSSRLYFLFFPFWLNIFYFCCQTWLWQEELLKFTSIPTLTNPSLSLHPPCQPARGPAHGSGSQSFPGGHARLSTRFEVMFLCNLWCSSAQLTGPRPGLTSAHPPRPTPPLTGPQEVPTPACAICRAQPPLPLLVLASAARGPAHPPSSAPIS